MGEEAALREYRRRGYSLVAQNWRCRFGEIDLVLSRAGTLVVCEVKTRRSSAMGGPHEAVTWRKQRKLRLLAEALVSELPTHPEEVRFDVASVILDWTGDLSVHVFQQAF